MGEPKSDWGKDLCEEVEKLSDAVKDMQTQLQTLTGQADECKDFRKEIQPSHWFVTHARGFIILFAVLIVSVIITLIAGTVSFAFWLGSLGSDVRHHATAISKAESSLEAATKENRQANDQLKQLILERLPRQVGVVLKQGTIDRLETVSYTVGSPPEQRTVLKLTAKAASGKEWACIPSPHAKITLDGKSAGPDELKPGMQIEATVDTDGVASVIEAKREAAKPPVFRHRVIPFPQPDKPRR